MSAPANLGDLLSAYMSAVAIHDSAFDAEDKEGASRALEGMETALLAIFARKPAGQFEARLWRHIILSEGLTFMTGDERFTRAAVGILCDGVSS